MKTALLFAVAGLCLQALALPTPTTLAPTPTTSAQEWPNCPPIPAAGSTIRPYPAVFSNATTKTLTATLNFRQTLDQGEERGFTQYCFERNTVNGPTLRFWPGDRMVLTVVNQLPPDTNQDDKITLPVETTCGTNIMDHTSVNLHFHGTHVSPKCTKDNAIHTLINSGQSFRYNILFPSWHPPGLYWYHPHVQGSTERQGQGGASGALVVEGMDKAYPAVAGLPEVILVFRDQILRPQYHMDNDPQIPKNSSIPQPGSRRYPEWDITVNHIPVYFPEYTPAVLSLPRSRAGRPIFWRFASACADATLELQLEYDGVPQSVQVVARDGIAYSPRPVTYVSSMYTVSAARWEFIAPAPSFNVKKAQIVTRRVDTGPAGDSNPARPLVDIVLAAAGAPTQAPSQQIAVVPQVVRPLPPSGIAPETASSRRAKAVSETTPVAIRKLFFSQIISVPSDPSSDTVFFITLEGDTPKAYSPLEAPHIISKKDTVEDWIIENHAEEIHVFHIHQIHFLVMERDGRVLRPSERVWLDTILVPAWDGKSTTPFPRVRLRMDFYGQITGEFVYHCHILEHEDKGMMATIKVVP